MTPFQIKVALMQRGVSLRSIAKGLGVSASAVSLIVNKKMVSKRIMEAVAEAIGSDLETVFPEYHRDNASSGHVREQDIPA